MDGVMGPIFTGSMKQRIRQMAPLWLLKFRQNYLINNPQRRYQHLSTKDIFTKIYEEGAWGESAGADKKYFSGTGSHNDVITNTYASAVAKFLTSFPEKPNVVDLGCGDFTVGSKIRHLCNTYIACDIVESLIDWNRQSYNDRNVDFRVLDLSEDELPAADIVFIRQVLQHLSNAHIARALAQLTKKYRYLVITEHLPSFGKFTPNLDKPAGASIRTGLNSGVVLTSAPFNLKVAKNLILAEVAEAGDIIRTNLYVLPSANGEAGTALEPSRPL